jgi:hypothetical protein
VGRLRLLAAKLVALAVARLVLVAVLALAAAVGVTLVMMGWTGGLDALASPPAGIGRELLVLLLASMISLAVCVVLGVAASTVGRSVAVGLTLAIGLFPLDNLLSMMLPGLVHDPGRNLAWGTTYLLGQNLNLLPHRLLGETGPPEIFPSLSPQVTVDLDHVLLVIAAYAAALLAVTAVVAWRRDVLD